jgi:drug/metabolite transporter (DMT)-like permease
MLHEARGDLRHAARRARALGERQPLVPLGVGVVLFSTGPVLVAASGVSGPVFSFWRLWAGTLILGGMALVHIRVTGRSPDAGAWALSVRAGVFFGLHQLLFMSALKATSVVDVTLVNTVAPIVTGALAVTMFGERPERSFRLWSLVAIAGTALIVLAGSSGPDGDLAGMLLAVGNVAFYAGFFLLSKRGRDSIDVVPFLAGAFAAAAVTVTAYAAAAGEPVGAIARHDLVLVVTVAVVPGTLGHFISTWPLRLVPANVPPLMLLAIPFLSGLMAWAFLGEAVRASHFVGGAVTMAGVAGALASPAGRRLMAGAAVPEAYPEA